MTPPKAAQPKIEERLKHITFTESQDALQEEGLLKKRDWKKERALGG